MFWGQEAELDLSLALAGKIAYISRWFSDEKRQSLSRKKREKRVKCEQQLAVCFAVGQHCVRTRY